MRNNGLEITNQAGRAFFVNQQVANSTLTYFMPFEVKGFYYCHIA